MPATMNAVQIAEYGGPEAVGYGPFPMPTAKPDEVLVQVVACGVNPIDWKIREGVRRANIPLEMPAVLGCDLSGLIAGVGHRSGGFRVGEAVFGMTGLYGAFSEYVAIKPAQLARKPVAISHLEAAATPLASMTAWQALKLAGLKAGQTVLIHAGAGGVGGFAVQIARAWGARVVATASAGKIAYVKSLGADQVIDYRTTLFEEEAGEVDVVFDLIGGPIQERSWSVLKRGGFLVSAVGVPETGDPRGLGRRCARVGVRPIGKDLKALAALIERGEIAVHVEQVLPMAAAAAAIEQVKQGHTRGKLVLAV